MTRSGDWGAIAGVPVHPIGMADTLRWINERRQARGPMAIVSTLNVDVLSTARRDVAFRELLRSQTALNLVDGAPVAWLLRLAGIRAQRTAGSDLSAVLLAPYPNGPSIFLLGDEQTTLEEIARRSEREGWSDRLAGWYSPVRREVDDPAASRAIVDRINASGAEVLLVGFGAPRQETWMARWASSLAPRVGISVGGAMKFIAWPRRRAPRWMQLVGLEWLYRTLHEPGRLGPRYAKNFLELSALWRSVTPPGGER